MEKMTKACKGIKGFFGREWTMGEKILLVLDCVLFGVVLGALWSPIGEKHVTMGSYNSGNGCTNEPVEKKK